MDADTSNPTLLETLGGGSVTSDYELYNLIKKTQSLVFNDYIDYNSYLQQH